jgi:hypothetical protein
MATTRKSPGGFTYRVVPVAGGEWHVWPNGQKTFVAKPPAAPKPTPAATPGADVAPAAPPAQGGASPVDATYLAQSAQAAFSLNQQRQANDTQGVDNTVAYTQAMDRLRRAYPQQRAATTANANRAGLLYSSTLGNELGKVDTSYQESVGSTQTSYDRAERARIAARQALEAGYPIDDAARMAAAADRQSARDVQAADAGVLAPDPKVTSPAANATQPKPNKTLKPTKPKPSPAMVARVKKRWLREGVPARMR